MLLEPAQVRLDLCEALHDLGVLAHGQAPVAQHVVDAVLASDAGVGRGVAPLQGAQGVGGDGERTRRGDRGVLLAQRARRGVARVGVGRLAVRDQCLVERLEVLHPQVDLATDLHELRHVVAREPTRHTRDREHVRGDVLAH